MRRITNFPGHLFAVLLPALRQRYGTSMAGGREYLFEPALRIEDGNVVFPDGPGWGVKVNEAWLEKTSYQKTEV